MSISFTLYLLGRYPDVQEKIFQELDEMFGNDIEREITSEDLKKMKYLECAIKVCKYNYSLRTQVIFQSKFLFFLPVQYRVYSLKSAQLEITGYANFWSLIQNFQAKVKKFLGKFSY